MTKSLITIQLEVNEEEAALWRGRFACIGPMTGQEWTDLWAFFASIDGFVEQVSLPLVALHKAVAANPNAPKVPDGTFRKLVEWAQDAEGVATLMPAIQQLMGRFAMVTSPKTKKGRVQ